MVRKLVILICVMFIPVVAFAQTGIAGVVRDTTGAVLPGVTVEASSPALIEKLRTVVTDDQGQYRIVDLRPGVYTVNFSLAGFSTVRREGIELSTNFMAQVNAELRVGALEETVTVSGASPVVDVQNVIQQRVITAEVIDALPTGRNLAGFGALIPGLAVRTSNRPGAQDVGGLSGERQQLSIHGGRGGDMTLYLDGMLYSWANTPGTSVFTLNTGEAEEFSYEIGAISAEVATGGVRTNLIPKTGGNLFKGAVFANYTNGSLQSDNVTADLQARGLQAGNPIEKVWDLNPSFGGPIKQDKLWFFGSGRYWGLQEYVAGNYYAKDPYAFNQEPDLTRQHLDDYWNTAASLRLTTQVTPRNKLSLYTVYEDRCQCHWQSGFAGNILPEASLKQRLPFIKMAQASWTSPLTSRLLLEAGMLSSRQEFHRANQPEVRADTTARIELATNTLFRANTIYSRNRRYTDVVRTALNYVTGSHAFKSGFTLQDGYEWTFSEVNGDIHLRSLNGVPRDIVVWTTPYTVEANSTDLGLYAQDQWTIKRMTLNLGVRFDYHNNNVPEQHLPAVRFVGARDFAEVRDVPNWTDLSPRLGVAYDLFGTGKTAIKVTLSRYLDGGTGTITAAVNPVNASVNSATRVWNDLNRDFLPQENELGPLSDPGFGQVRIRTRYDDDVREGFGKRGFNWETSAGVQHELLPQVSVNATYFRRWYGNITATDNLLNTPADYDPYCITAPVDARLPGGGGNQICGLFDVNPAKRATNNFVTFADNFGEQTEVYDGVDFTANVRLPRGGLLAGGVSIGRHVLDICDVQGKVDNAATGRMANSTAEGWWTAASPSTRFCHQSRPFQPLIKFLGSFNLPWDIQAAATFQSQPGPEIMASQVVTSDQVRGSLGRNLTLGTAIVDLIEPGTQFEKRYNQVDLRLAKIVGLGRNKIKGMLDLYNMLNASPVLALNNRYGAQWLRPTYIMPGRLIKFGAQLDF